MNQRKGRNLNDSDYLHLKSLLNGFRKSRKLPSLDINDVRIVAENAGLVGCLTEGCERMTTHPSGECSQCRMKHELLDATKR